METKIIIGFVVCSILSALAYRCGGMDKETKHWLPVWLRHSWVRDWLCPLCVLAPFFMLTQSWWFLLSYLLIAGALSTYWDFLFGYDNFWFSGFMCGIALFPLIFCGFLWWIILVRAILLSLAWGVICKVSGNDFVEEYGRGSTLVLI